MEHQREHEVIALKIYHGSYTEIPEPKLNYGRRVLDFGAGFYCTSSMGQAKKWAIAVAKRRHGIPVVNCYEFDPAKNQLKTLIFDTADTEWFRLVVGNRTGNKAEDDGWDLIIGPVADDRTLRVIDDYIDGFLNEEEAIRRMETQNLHDQYTFKTQAALDCLSFEGCEYI